MNNQNSTPTPQQSEAAPSVNDLQSQAFAARSNPAGSPPAGNTVPAPTAPGDPLAAALAYDLQHNFISQAEYDSQMLKLGKGSASNTVQPPAQSSAPSVEIVREGGLTEAQRQIVAQDIETFLLKKTDWTPEQKETYRNTHGVGPVTPDTRSETAKAVDAEMGPPGQPADYVFVPYEDEHGKVDRLTPEMKQFDTMARSALAEAKFPQGHGTALAKAVTDAAKEHSRMSSIEKHTYRERNETILKNLWRENYKDNLSMAKQLARELGEKYPALVHMLDQTGAGNSARVVVALHQQAQLLSRRKGYTK